MHAGQSGAGMHAGGQAHGLLLLNSNGIEAAITPTRLQLRAIGGVLDLYFFTGPTPLEVLSQLTSIVGRPVMPPYWSLGLMQSKCASPSCCPAQVQPFSQASRGVLMSSAS
jgi:alpha-glucosidase (family GH31 glycosyl hydrolase)